ncbi:MAG: VanZ family protein [Clostridia bacterium]|nr:VanZ family protein [Clostridia bacterium]
MTELYQAIYHRPLADIIGWMTALTLAWAVLRLLFCISRRTGRVWMWTNRVLCVCSVLGVLIVTVFMRSGAGTGISLKLFELPLEPGPRDEYPRMLLMNAFLFLPLGMSLGSSWPDEWTLPGRIAWTAVGGFAVTLTCELLQLLLSRGTFEIDDLTMNLAGVLLGLVHVVPADLILSGVRLLIKKRKKKV